MFPLLFYISFFSFSFSLFFFLYVSAFPWSLKKENFKRSSKPSLFPAARYFDLICDEEASFNDFKVATPSFLAFGHMIKSIYGKSVQVTSYLTTKMSLSDICDMNNCDYNDNPAEENLSKTISQHSPEPLSCRIPTPNPAPIRDAFREAVPYYFR